MFLHTASPDLFPDERSAVLCGLPTSSGDQGHHIVLQASGERALYITVCLAHDVLTVTTRRCG